MNGVQTRFKCKLDVKRCKRFVFPPSSLLPRSNALKTKAIRYFQTDRTLTRIVSPPLDECSIAAVLYEAKDASGKDVTLTGVDINTSEYRVAEARLKDGTDKEAWTAFELTFEYFPDKVYDSTKEYKLAIVCSSSKEGDKFRGAANSTLIVDELEVVGE